jgi:hypothetical protein
MSKINLILPKNGVEPKDGARVYFLAGPVKGGADWQAKAIMILAERDPDCYIVCPCPYNFTHHLYQHSLPPTYNKEDGSEPDISSELKQDFNSQTQWERYYLKQAAFRGSIIFWLPCEDQKNPRKKEEGPYARDTYGELGRWSVHSSRPISVSLPYVNIVVGVEENFSGRRVIKKNLDFDHGKDFLVWGTLFDTLTAAIKLAKRNSNFLKG